MFLLSLALLGTTAVLYSVTRPRSPVEPAPSLSGGHAVPVEPSGSMVPPRLIDVAQSRGIDFVHEPGPTGLYFFPEIMGSGAALLDYDSDGDLDVYMVNGTTAAPHPAASGSPVDAHVHGAATNRLYRQNADGWFVDVTKGSGLGDAGYGMGVAVGDVNNDGAPDVYVTNYGLDRLFVNDGKGIFRNLTEEAGIDNPSWGTSACFFDFDADGRLDLYVANYVRDDNWRKCRGLDGHPDYCQPNDFSGAPDKLYRNISEGGVVRFEDVSASSGIASMAAPGLGVVSADFNGDRRLDLYVANDGTANFLWINVGNGTFREEALLRGAAFNADGEAQASMGIALGDIGGDGQPDLLLTHLGEDTNTLYSSDGTIGFIDDSVRSGIASPSFRYTGFGTVLADFDHDGDLDLVAVNGKIRRAARPDVSGLSPAPSLDLPEFWREYAEPGLLLLNDGNGRFVDVSSEVDSLTARPAVSRGLACGDIDNDGDLDVLISDTAQRPRLLVNETSNLGHWLVVRTVEPSYGGRDAYGAVVTVIAGGRTWTRYVNSGGSYLSSHDPRVHFGLGSADRIDRLNVVWPDGGEETFIVESADRCVTVRHGEGRSP